MATTTAPKVIYIGVEPVYDVLVKIKPEWDFAPCVEDISTFWDKLESGELDQQSQVILVLDAYFDERGADNQFEQLVASLAPYALVGIINYRPDVKESISERVESEAYTLSIGVTPQYYWIDPKKPEHSLDSAVSRFASETDLIEVAEILTGRTIERDEVANEAPVQQSSGFDFQAEEDEADDVLGQVVAVTSSKGGSGKSTVAITLATYLAHSSVNSVREGLEEKPLKVVILDLDVRDGQLGFLTNNSKPTVVQMRMDGISRDSVERTVIKSQRLKVDLLLAPKRPRHADDTPADFYSELIQQLRKMYDYIILDTSVNYLDPLLEQVAYPMADQIVFVTDIVISSIYSMTRWVQEVTKPTSQMGMGISKKKIGIVLNKSLGGVAMPGERIYQASLGLPIITPIPSNPKIIASAANTQQMDLLIQHNDIRESIRRLAKALVGRKYTLSNSVEK